MRLCLVEDGIVNGLEPLSLTRPAYELLLGSQTLGDKIARAFGIGSEPARHGAMIRPHLAALWRLRKPGTAINDQNWLARAPVLVVNARWVTPADFLPPDSVIPWVGTCDSLPACPPARPSAPTWPSASNGGESTPGSTRWHPGRRLWNSEANGSHTPGTS